MRPAPAPLNAKVRHPDPRECEGQAPGDLAVHEQLEEQLQFERPLTNLSATFVNVAAEA